MKTLRMLWVVLLVLLAAGCDKKDPTSSASALSVFRILAGSENKTLQPLLERFASQNNLQLKVDYRGSVDMMLMLQNGKPDYDAVWSASSLWLTLGDKQKIVKETQSIFWSPVVLGVKKSVAQRLGWIGKKEVRVQEILAAAESGNLRFMMTSATQSNSGAASYLGFLYAFAGNPAVLTSAHLNSPPVRKKITRILGAAERSSGSSGWLKDLFLQKYDAYDAMINYESVVIETNQALISQGREPLYAIYPADGLAIADSPLGRIESQDASKAELFRKLQEYLLSPAIQQEILRQGRRIGAVGADIPTADRTVFNPEWGITLDRFLNQIRFPNVDVIRLALDEYQMAFRKPSLTIFCLDFSGSMRGDRVENLKSAMRMLLDQDQARRNLLQASRDDITVVIPFDYKPRDEWVVRGNDANALRQLWAKVNTTIPDGGTDIYTPAMRAMEIIRATKGGEGYFPAVILLTDGESNTGATFDDWQAAWNRSGLKREVPVYAIQFGDASGEQLKRLAGASSGRVFDGTSDLARAFREAKGYN